MHANLVVLATLFGFLQNAAHAHENDAENIPEGSVVSPDPLDVILWLHIAGMIVAFGKFLGSNTKGDRASWSFVYMDGHY